MVAEQAPPLGGVLSDRVVTFEPRGNKRGEGLCFDAILKILIMS